MQAPEPHAVNQFCWELRDYRTRFPDKWVVVHCTHGFNRTGTFSGPPLTSVVLPGPCTQPCRWSSICPVCWQCLPQQCITERSNQCARHLTQSPLSAEGGSELRLVSAGYMLVSMLMRQERMGVYKALTTFMQHRPAGIYKDEYIRALFKYCHEPL